MSLLRSIARPLLVVPLAIDALDAVIHPDRHVAKLEKFDPVLSRIQERSEIEDLTPYLSHVTRASGAVTLQFLLHWAKRPVPRPLY